MTAAETLKAFRVMAAVREAAREVYGLDWSEIVGPRDCVAARYRRDVMRAATRWIPDAHCAAFLGVDRTLPCIVRHRTEPPTPRYREFVAYAGRLIADGRRLV